MKRQTGSTPTTLKSQWTDGHSHIQPGLLTGAGSASARLWARQGEGRRDSTAIPGGKLSQPGLSWYLHMHRSGWGKVGGQGVCAGGRVTQGVGWPLFRPEGPGGGTHLA